MDSITVVPNVTLDLDASLKPLERIGMGFCGSVWASTDSSDDDGSASLPVACMKREDGGPGRSLMNEYHIHKLVNQAVSSGLQHVTSFSVPLCHGFLNESDAAQWSKILPLLPPGSSACNTLLSQKVQPVSETARRLLATTYAKGHDHEAIIGDKKNKHCLIRPYLGRRRHRARRPGKPTFFSLRNFPLHIDQMEELGLSIHPYVISMAESLAFLLWVARIDANDVEFVLGRQATNSTEHENAGILGPHSMWIIDFDCCKPLPMDKDGVEIAARCFWRNDPFYPRPGSSNTTDQELWTVFQQRFLQASELMLHHESSSMRELPCLLINKIVETKGKYNKGTVF